MLSYFNVDESFSRVEYVMLTLSLIENAGHFCISGENSGTFFGVDLRER